MEYGTITFTPDGSDSLLEDRLGPAPGWAYVIEWVPLADPRPGAWLALLTVLEVDTPGMPFPDFLDFLDDGEVLELEIPDSY